jgi:UDPglucose--hexose-1-phosphate uridylyltransferase
MRFASEIEQAEHEPVQSDRTAELRRDPITNTWVLQMDGDNPGVGDNGCPFCPGIETPRIHTIYQQPWGDPNWRVRVVPHLDPIYRIEGDARRHPEGMYDRMRNLGAHEVVVEHPNHRLSLSQHSVEHIAEVLGTFVSRISDLKRDRRFRYVTVFRNQGTIAGQEFDHPHSEITATPFIPRRVGYELRWSQRHFELKERCLACDILKQELSDQTRTVEWDEMFVAFCPYASRVPYETWLFPVNHHCAFEEDVAGGSSQLRLARILKSVLLRLETISPAYHLVLHTCPNVNAKFERTGNWQTLADDYHWHLEILPLVPGRSKPYTVKEIYCNTVTPENAARELRRIAVSG